MSRNLIIEISIPYDGWTRLLSEADGICRRAALAAWQLAPTEESGAAEVSLMLTDDETIRGLNRTYRGKDQATNVLSFAAREGDAPEVPGDEPELLGDIVIAYETVTEEAGKEGKAPADHLSHLVVHGMLHLLGFDHQTDRDARIMEPLEIKALEALGISNPYLSALENKEAAG
ncbi:MAG: rRNA maturation RNase YbeY [Rhodospirillales bacterium]|nr:rRNA maturation RNase YbeY [Rhodospirillales bacterium]